MKKLATVAGILLAATLPFSGNAANAGSCSLTALATCAITEGDKTISDISITGGGFIATLPQDLMFSIASGSWVVQTVFGPDQSTTQSSTSANPIVLSYTVTINDPTKKFNKWTIQGDDNTLNGGNTVQTVTVAGGNPVPVSLTSFDSANPIPANSTFMNDTSVINVTSSFYTNGTTTFNSISQKFTQRDMPTQGVPGPLPLLGAGAAFGFSRRLRNRIKQLA
jgi:hypothetical protein